jgi:hypothetical protein
MRSRVHIVRSANVLQWVCVRGNTFRYRCDWRSRVKLPITEVVKLEALHGSRLESAHTSCHL